MGKFIAAVVLGVLLFAGAVWSLGMMQDADPAVNNTGSAESPVTPLAELGADLYEAAAFPKLERVEAPAQLLDPVVVAGFLRPIEEQEVPSQVPGQVLFVGEAVPEGAVQAAGVAAFLAEPYYYATVWAGERPAAYFYRRFYEGQAITHEQMVAMVDPTKALGQVQEKRAKLEAAEAEVRAAQAAHKEAKIRLITAEDLYARRAISREELGTAQVTAASKLHELETKQAYVNVSVSDLYQAEAHLRLHEIRNKLPYRQAVIKTINRPRGFAVKELEAVMVVHSNDRLQAETQLEAQYQERLRRARTATIEPIREQSPARTLPGHRSDVTALAVTRDRPVPRIVSADAEGLVYLRSRYSHIPLRQYSHGAPVRALACAPAGSARNWCVTGGEDGSLRLWDLDSEADEPIKAVEKAHADAVTAVAFGPDGAYFATGAADGTIKLWRSEGGQEVYPFDREHGVGDPHRGAVTTLTFLPQCRLVSAARDNTVRVWQLKQKGAAPQGRPISGRDGKVAQLGVSRDGRFMLFDQGRTLQLLAVESGLPISTLSAPGGSTPFETVALVAPDASLLLTAGAPEGRLQLWRTPTATERGFEVRQFLTDERAPVACAAFAPFAGQGGEPSFAVSASKSNVYVWQVPTAQEAGRQRIENVPLTLVSQNREADPRKMRIGFELANPDGRLIPGMPVTIVIE